MVPAIDLGNRFYRAITNNQYAGAGVTPPQRPSFAYPGKDLKDDDPSESSGKLLEFEA